MTDTDFDQQVNNNADDTTNSSEVEILKQKLAETELNWKRALADYKNLEKRSIEEKEATILFANALLLQKFLAVLDNFEMIEKHTDDMGLKLTVKEFKKVFKDEGIEEVETKDKDFDPNLMEAIETVEGKPNKVVEVLQNGYLYNGKLLRAARVKVGKVN